MKKLVFVALLGLAGCAAHHTATGEANPMSETSKTIHEATQAGQSVVLPELEVDITKPPFIPYTKEVVDGPQYLISDDPEYIRVPEGIALQEVVKPGSVRLYVYNVNGVKEPEMDRKISVVIENLGEEPLTVDWIRYSSPEPSDFYHMVAKEGLVGYFTYPEQKKKEKPVVLQPGEAAPLDWRMEERVVTYNELAHTLHEFTIDQPARISVVQTAPETSSMEAVKRIGKVLESPKRNAGRGLFQISNYEVRNEPGYVLDSANGLAQLRIADGKRDPWVKGVDGSTGKELELRGNYGIMYDIELERKSSDGRGMALVTWNAAAGAQWCGGMINVLEVSEGVFPGGMVPIPSDKDVNRAAPEVVLVQLFPPLPDGKTEKISITYSAPGATCLPTPLLFVPVEWPAKK